MILKIVAAIAIALFALIAIPSIIATFTLLIKSIGDFGDKRRRPTFHQR
jgi:hypothetical protein